MHRGGENTTRSKHGVGHPRGKASDACRIAGFVPNHAMWTMDGDGANDLNEQIGRPTLSAPQKRIRSCTHVRIHVCGLARKGREICVRP
jgi:hypothetical protein